MPYITFVILAAVFAQELAVLPEAAASMVFFRVLPGPFEAFRSLAEDLAAGLIPYGPDVAPPGCLA
jgi:hypothetical protein